MGFFDKMKAETARVEQYEKGEDIMRKKWIAGILILALTAMSMTGCGQKEENPDVGEQPTTFTYWCNILAVVADKYQTMGEMAMYKEMEKKTGIHIEFIHPTIGQEDEQFALMLASREFPDLIESAWSYYAGGAEKAIEDQVIIKLNDIMEEHAPNFTQAVQSNKEYDRQSKTDNGVYYGFPSLSVGSYRIFGGILIREDWLNDLGLPMPQTVEEWETTLRAFKEEKGASAPFTGESTLFSPGYINTFNNAFNVGKDLYLEDDVVKYGPLEPGYKEWIDLMHRWYEEGLLDRDYATNGKNAVDAKITDGTSGACFGYIGGNLGTYLARMEDDPTYSLVGAPYPVANKGEQPKFGPLGAEADNPFLAISTACKYPEAAARWADFWYTEEGLVLSNFGVEGETYNLVDGKHVYTDEILHNPEGRSISEALSLHCRATGAAPGYNQVEEYLQQYYPYPQQTQALDLWTQSTENIKKHTLPGAVSPLLEESDELAILQTDLSTYVTENVVKFVQGGLPMSEFDQFVETLKSMGAERYVEIYQSAYDRYLQR